MDIAQAIRDAIRTLNLADRVYELTALEAEQAVAATERRFITRPNVRWWWAALTEKLPVVSFTPDDGDGHRLLPSICPNEEAWLVASDDEDPPWPVFLGSPSDFCLIVGECPYFEYSVVSRKLEWLVLENHHNTLFAVGEPVATKLGEYAG